LDISDPSGCIYLAFSYRVLAFFDYLDQVSVMEVEVLLEPVAIVHLEWALE